MQLTLEKVTLKRTGIVYYVVFAGAERKIATDKLEKAQSVYETTKQELTDNPLPVTMKDHITEVLKSEEI